MITGWFSGKWADKYGKPKVFGIGVVLTCIPIYLITTMTSNTLVYEISITTMFFVFNTIRIVPGMIIIKKSDGIFENYDYVSYLAIIVSLLAIILVRKFKSEY